MIVYVNGEKYDSAETPIAVDFKEQEVHQLHQDVEDDEVHGIHRFVSLPRGMGPAKAIEMMFDEDPRPTNKGDAKSPVTDREVDVKGKARVIDEEANDQD